MFDVLVAKDTTIRPFRVDEGAYLYINDELVEYLESIGFQPHVDYSYYMRLVTIVDGIKAYRYILSLIFKDCNKAMQFKLANSRIEVARII